MNMGELFECYDREPMRGKDITIADLPAIFISEMDEVFYYPGICLNDEERRTRASFMRPHYMQGKHSTDKAISKEIKGFYRVVDGCIVLDKYVDDKFHEKDLFKRIEAYVRLATPGSCYYGVFKSYGNEDEVLTRKVFGLTYDELTELLESYAKMMGTNCEFSAYPKLTRSIKNTNFCDITDGWIPETFPYIAFKESGYDFSHVSFFGFYRHIQLLTGREMNSLISRALLQSGLNEDILKKVFGIGCNLYSQPKVTSDIIWSYF